MTQARWRRGGFQTARAGCTILLALAFAFVTVSTLASGTHWLAIVAVVLAVLMVFGVVVQRVKQSVFVLTAQSLTLCREPFPWRRQHRIALCDPATVRAHTYHVEGELLYTLEVIVGLKLAHCGDFANLEDAERVARVLDQEVDKLQGRREEVEGLTQSEMNSPEA